MAIIYTKRPISPVYDWFLSMSTDLIALDHIENNQLLLIMPWKCWKIHQIIIDGL